MNTVAELNKAREEEIMRVGELEDWLSEHHPNVKIVVASVSPEGVPEMTFDTAVTDEELVAILDEFDAEIAA